MTVAKVSFAFGALRVHPLITLKRSSATRAGLVRITFVVASYANVFLANVAFRMCFAGLFASLANTIGIALIVAACAEVVFTNMT